MVTIDGPASLYTVGQIAERYGVSVSRTVYIVRSRDIRPVGRAGRIRLFDEPAADEVGRVLERIDRNRGAMPCS